MARQRLRTARSNRLSAVGQWDQVELSELRSAERRTRRHSATKQRSVQASIEEWGILDPVTVNDANVIVDGHLRVDIARKLGFRTVPVIRISHLSDAELRAYAIAANKLPADAKYDLDALRIEFEGIRAELPSLDLTLTGFTIGEVDRIVGNHAAAMYDDLDDTQAATKAGIAVAQTGNVFALGDHRVICGDALDPAIVAKLMGDEAAACCFTDPPYNVKINGHVSGTGRHAEFAMASGEMTVSEFESFLTLALSNIAEVLIDGAIAFVCMDHAHVGELLLAGDRVFDKRLNLCVWDKGRGGMGSLYRSQHELVAVFKKGQAPHRNNVSLGRNGRNRTNIWSFPGISGLGRGRKALELHPTVKPVALIAEALLDVTSPGDIVLDAFGGSGSTLIAAERIGRKARLIEFDPIYVDRIIARWEKLTGGEAVRLELADHDDRSTELQEGENG